MTTPPDLTAPRFTHSRIALLDILRGLALLGMVVVHFHQRFRLTAEAERPGEWLVGWIIWVGLETKAWATFALLFGVGFAIVLRRADSTGKPLVAPYLRRLAALAAVGIALEALTDVSILLEYAIWGVPLLLVRNWSSRALLVLAVAAAMAFPGYHFVRGVYELTRPAAATQIAATPQPAPSPPDTWRATVIERLERLRAETLRWDTLLPRSSFALFIIGFLAVRHGLIDEPRRHLRVIAGAMIVGLVSWLIFWLVLQKLPDTWTQWHPRDWTMRYGFWVVSDQWLAFTYVGAATLLLTYREKWVARLAPVALTGRMALTLYVLQAFVIEFLWSRFWVGAALRPYEYVFAALSLFAAMLLISALWFGRFRYGPLEWAWRAFTYLRTPPIRRADEAPAVAGARADISEQ